MHVLYFYEMKWLAVLAENQQGGCSVPRNAGSHDPALELPKTMRALLLVQLRDMKQREQVELLDRAGFGQSEIAALIGTTSNAVSVRLAEIRNVSRRLGKK